MTSHVDQVKALLTEAARMPVSLGRYELLDEAVRIADLHNDVELGVEARMPLLWVAGSLLRGDAMAVAFTWCLHQYDRRPELFGGRNLFEEYRMLIGRLANFDTVSRAQLEEMLDDLAARLAREGMSPALVWEARLAIAPDVGDREFGEAGAREYRRHRMEGRLPTNVWFNHALFMGDEDGAMRIAEKEWLADRHRVSFDSHWYDVLTLLLKRDRMAEFRQWLKRATGQIHVRDTYYWPYGTVVRALALCGKIDEAVKLCGHCQRAIREYTDPLTRLHFHLDMGVLFERLHSLGKESVLVRFAEGPPGLLPSGRYVVAEVREWMAREARELTERFDRRNGNGYFAELTRARADLQRYALPEEE